MAKTVKDLVAVTEIMLRAAKTPRNFTIDLTHIWANFKLGFVSPALWRLPPHLLTMTEEYCRQVVSVESAIVTPQD